MVCEFGSCVAKCRFCCLCQFDAKNVGAAAAAEEEEVKNTTYEDISAKDIKCTVMGCTAFESANQASP